MRFIHFEHLRWGGSRKGECNFLETLWKRRLLKKLT